MLVVDTVSHRFPHIKANLFLTGESKQVSEGMLLSCLRRWAGQPKPAEERKSKQFCARKPTGINSFFKHLIHTPTLTYST